MCNVATQAGETVGYDLAAHVEALTAHTGPGIADLVVANNHVAWTGEPGDPTGPVQLRWPPESSPAPRLILDDVVDRDAVRHHDPARLATTLLRALEHESGARRRPAFRTA